MATAQDLIDQAFRKIGLVPKGQSPSTTDRNDGLSALRLMLESWSLKDALIYQTVTNSANLTSGSYSVSLATSPNHAIETTKVFYLSGTEEIYLDPMSRDEYYALSDKGETGVPTKYYCEIASAGFIFYFDKKANQTYALNFVTTQSIHTSTLALATNVSLALGYERAIVYNLAIELALEYSIPVDPIIIGVAGEALTGIQDRNIKRRFFDVGESKSELSGMTTQGYDINEG